LALGTVCNTVIDLHPAANRTIRVITSLADDQLDAPTPCPDAVVGHLVDHLGVFAVRFRAAARKEAGGPTSPPPPPSGSNLEAGWRERLSRDLVDLADAWSDPRAWEGLTYAGGIEMPAEVVGVVALDELIVHGWDLAVATGQAYEVPTPEIDAAIGFVTAFEAPRDGRLFGPIVPAADDAPPLDRLLSLTGRDPRWQPRG
jgi:uncharacterized protein (TIGR03086 family)